MSEQPAVAVGQVWEEVDPRHPRRVVIMAFSLPFGVGPTYHDGTVTIRGIEGATRKTKAKLSRFNGNRGGYRFVSEGAE